jgi:hypothetical protein
MAPTHSAEVAQVDRGSFYLAIRAILAGPTGLRQLYLMHARREFDRAAMINSFFSANAQQIAQAVVDYCQTNSISREFPVEVEDNISTVFGLVGEDIVDMLVSVCDSCAVTRPSGSEFRHAHIKTVKDMIDFISRQCHT